MRPHAPSPGISRPAPHLRRERMLAVGLAVALTVLRSATLVGFEGARFDSDQALLGLMAKHLIEGRAFPVFTYGQPYMLGVEAWMAAPFFLVGGPTVQMLKLPLLLVNVAAAVLLVLGLERFCRLRPLVALVPALFFVLVAPGTATLLLEASGGNVEPFLMVLLLWIVRRRPLAFGALLAFGVLQREFTIYALGAVAILAVVDGSLRRRDAWKPIAMGAVAFGAVWQGIYLLKQFSSINGPGTYAKWAPLEASANLHALAGRFCLSTDHVVTGLQTLVTSHVGYLLGALPKDQAAFTINSLQWQGAPWAWPVLGVALLAGLLRVGWIAWRGQLRLWAEPYRFGTYLFLVGLQALVAHALFRCGVVSIAEMRYSLLGVFAAVGLTALFLSVEPSRRLRGVAVAIVLAWAAVSATAHVRLAHEYLTDPPVNARRVLADTLLERGIRYATADFWESLTTVFLTNEQVIVASTSFVFIDEYQWLVERRANEAVAIRREPCPGGTRVADWLYICGPQGGSPESGR